MSKKGINIVALTTIMILITIFIEILFIAWVARTEEKIDSIEQSDCNCYTSPCICNETFICEDKRINNIQASHNDISIAHHSDGLFLSGVYDGGQLFGYSMQPAIFEGNKILVQPYIDQELKEGMIIRYYDERGEMIHRIKGVYEKWGYVVTQGDNNGGDDGRVHLEDITDVVVGVLYT